MTETAEKRRDWNWEHDGALDGMFVAMRQVTVKNGPSAGQTKTVIDFHVGVDDELVTVWLSTVLARMLREELKARQKQRGAANFEPGERLIITPKGMREGERGEYRDFEDVVFEHPAAKPSALDMLGPNDAQTEDDDFLPASKPDDDGDIAF